MTYHREVWLMCDGEDCVRDGPGGGRTAAEARKYARQQGWLCRGGEDYCPNCKEDV